MAVSESSIPHAVTPNKPQPFSFTDLKTSQDSRATSNSISALSTRSALTKQQLEQIAIIKNQNKTTVEIKYHHWQIGDDKARVHIITVDFLKYNRTASAFKPDAILDMIRMFASGQFGQNRSMDKFATKGRVTYVRLSSQPNSNGIKKTSNKRNEKFDDRSLYFQIEDARDPDEMLTAFMDDFFGFLSHPDFVTHYHLAVQSNTTKQTLSRTLENPTHWFYTDIQQATQTTLKCDYLSEHFLNEDIARILVTAFPGILRCPVSQFPPQLSTQMYPRGQLPDSFDQLLRHNARSA